MENLIPYLVPAVIVVIVVLLLLLGYVKAPPDMAYIISGVKKKSKVVIEQRLFGKGKNKQAEIQYSCGFAAGWLPKS